MEHHERQTGAAIASSRGLAFDDRVNSAPAWPEPTGSYGTPPDCDPLREGPARRDDPNHYQSRSSVLAKKNRSAETTVFMVGTGTPASLWAN